MEKIFVRFLSGSVLATLVLAYQNCSPGYTTSGQSSSIRTIEAIDKEAAGKALYAENCMACHGQVDFSSKRGITAQSLNAAIPVVPEMNFLSRLSSNEINLIVSVLAIKSDTVAVGNKTLFVCDQSKVRTNAVVKLSRREFSAVLTSLLNDFGSGLSADTQFQTLLTNLPSDISPLAFTREENSFYLSQQIVAAYFEASYRAAELMAGSSSLGSYPNTSGCLANASLTQACHRSLVQELAGRAFRRSIPTAEVTVLANSLWDSTLTKTEMLMETFATLASYPDFLYKGYNNGASLTGQTLQITGLDLANKLSFFLTGRPADSTLVSVAVAGGLETPATFSAQVDRLLATSAGRETIQRFFREAYGHDVTGSMNYSSNFLDGASTTGLASAMVSEMDSFFGDEVLTKRSSFQGLMTSRGARVSNSALAAIYGVTGNASSEITLPLERSGFLNRAAYLTKRSSYYASPIKRGRHVMENLLCESLGDPPANAPSAVSETQITGQLRSTRTRYQSLTEQSGTTCVGCHSVLNPYGYALEAFDALGRRRTQERIFNTSTDAYLGSVSVDTSASVRLLTSGTVTQVSEPAQFTAALGTSDKALLCFARHLTKFEVRETAGDVDYCQMNEVLNVLYGSTSQGSVYDAIKAYVTSSRFRTWKY